MHKNKRLYALLLSVACLLALPVQAESICDPDGLQSSGSVYRICMPPPDQYNGSLVVWAHGFQDAGTPVQIPEDQQSIGGVSIAEIVNSLGFGFATNSYSKTGLAVRQGMADILDLVSLFSASKGAPQRVYLTGASEGGLITTLLTEQHPEVFTGGLAACGPVGDFRYQINYFGDARLLFEIFFPGLIPGDPLDPPQALADTWTSYYEQKVKPVVFDPANRYRLNQWARTAKLPFGPNDYLKTLEVSVRDVLRYAVVNANDAKETLGGSAFDNRDRLYTGSDNDLLLNLIVPRIRADQAALAEINSFYNTSGRLSIPLITIHTTSDQQVPFLHEVIYSVKTLSTGSLISKHIPFSIARYGHCNFQPAEVVTAFAVLLQSSGWYK